MLILMSVYLLMTSILANNPCHPDCQAYMCNGPLSTDCHVCSHPNKTGRQESCKCKVGWFDYGGAECSVFKYDCVSAVITSPTAITCLLCDHLQYSPIIQE
jgi:hypothetical protein